MSRILRYKAVPALSTKTCSKLITNVLYWSIEKKLAVYLDSSTIFNCERFRADYSLSSSELY